MAVDSASLEDSLRDLRRLANRVYIEARSAIGSEELFLFIEVQALRSHCPRLRTASIAGNEQRWLSPQA